MADSLQEQVAALKRAHILAAAARVFAAQGFHATTVKEVARAADVSVGTIYNAFEDKTALLLAVFDELALAAKRAVDPAELAALDARGLLVFVLDRPLRAFGEQHLDLFRVVMSEVLVNRDLAERFAERVLAPMADGPFPGLWAARTGAPLPHPDLFGRTVAALVLGLLVQYALGDETLRRRWTEIPERLADLLLPGLTRADASGAGGSR